jgi:hypothetical protein
LKNRFRRKQRPATFSSSPITQLLEKNAETLQPARADMTPRRRLRHDNSQIQFVPIESSPLPSDIESQLLTERQKEVKERQRGSNAMFLEDLPSSSPALPSPTKETGVLTPVKLSDLQDIELGSDDLLTPTLAANLQENDDDFPGSSPTPSAKDRSIQSQKVSSFPLDVSQTEIAPPSEIQSRSPRRPAVRRKSALRRSESYTSDADNRVENGSGRRRSTRRSVTRSSGPTTEETPVREASPKQLNKPDSNSKTLPELEDAPLDEIPDTYKDEFEQQLASQLGQDLELAVDLQDIEYSQPSNTADLPPAPVTRKRKRDTVTDAEHSPVPDRGKRRSLRSSQSAATEDNVNTVIKENNTTAGPTTRRSGLSAKDVVTPQSSPTKGVSTPDPVASNMINSGSRRRRRLNDNYVPEIPSSLPQVEPRSLKRRRSQRLSGILSSPVTKSDSMPTTPRKQQNHAQSSPVNPGTSTPSSRSLRRMTRLSEVAAIPDANESTEDATNDLDPEPTLPSEIPDQETKILTSDEPSPQESVQSKDGDVAMSMEDPNSSIPALTEEAHKQTGEYVSHEVQTDTVVDNEGETQGGGIVSSLRQILSDIKSASFGRGVLREIDDLMFDIRVEAVKRSQA